MAGTLVGEPREGGDVIWEDGGEVRLDKAGTELYD